MTYDAQLEAPPPVYILAIMEHATMVASRSGVWVYASAADAVTEAIQEGKRVRLTDQGHVVDPTTFAPTLNRFLGGEPVRS